MHTESHGGVLEGFASEQSGGAGSVETGWREGEGKGAGGGNDIKPVIRSAVI